MFSYRHAFHAGNHADVLKHVTLVQVLAHLTQKPAPLTVVDTHAGAGLYRLDGDYSAKGGEATDGIFKLFEPSRLADADSEATDSIAPAIRDYLDLVAGFNAPSKLVVYPGSPFVIQRLLRHEARDKLKLFELHPTDAKALVGNVAQLEAGRQVTVERRDGFEALKGLLPPPARRALVLIDPSYEIKSDYAKVAACLQDSLKRFSTGVYMVWYPLIARIEAHDLPRRLKTLANQAGKPWLAATLSIGQPAEARQIALPGERTTGVGLTASGLFIINPPHSLKAALQQALPQLVQRLGRGRGQDFSVDSGG
ncbi:MAG: 23S rRNA (adenine(2030)-N(6))-methyltransferase RlmJ [Burkholderiales bacterium]